VADRIAHGLRQIGDRGHTSDMVLQPNEGGPPITQRTSGLDYS
jgi:hypothetical protein